MKRLGMLVLMLSCSLSLAYRDIETGTFLTRDPIGYGDGPNVYCYVHCNPIIHFDPLGLDPASPYQQFRYNTEPGYSYSKNSAEIGRGYAETLQDPKEMAGFKIGLLVFLAAPQVLTVLDDMDVINPTTVPTVDNLGNNGGGNQPQGTDAAQDAADLNQLNSQNSTGNSIANSGSETTQRNAETLRNNTSNPYRNQTDSQLQKSLTSYEELLDEHKKKLNDYIADPYSPENDNLDKLKNAPPDRHQKMIEGRIKVIEEQIEKHEGELDKILEVVTERESSNG